MTGLAVLGVTAALTVLLFPGAPANWDDFYTEMSQRRHRSIVGTAGAEKHVHGLEYYYMSRSYGNPGVNVDRAVLDAQMDIESRMNRGFGKTAVSNEWKVLGPANTAGRIRALAFNPQNPDIVYAGGASGGVFKSEQAGLSGSWRPVMDFADAIPVGALAVDPVNPDIVYAGTGEPTMELTKSYGAPSYRGVGVMKSTDAGESWTRMPWPDNSSAIHTIIIDPRDTDVVLVASRDNLYRSDDGGQDWSRVQSGVITDVAFREDNPDMVFAAIGRDQGTSINGVYRSTNGGRRFSWSKMNENWPDPDSTGRIELATTPADPNLLLAFVMRSRTTQNGDADFLAIMRSTDDGESWERVRTNLGADYTSGQGFYNLCAAISPTDPDVVLTGGLEVYQSQNGAESWTKVTRGNSPVHVDQHILEFTPDGNYVYLGNDGGVYRSATNGSSWTPLNDNLETIQFYTLAWDPNDPARFYGGAQDHGIFQSIDLDRKSWRLRRGGDGGYVVVDPTNSSIIYSRVAVEGGSQSVPSRSTNGGSSWTRLDRGFGSVEQDRFNWLPPMMLSPDDNTRMYTATQFVYTAKNVHQGQPLWAPISPDLTKRQSFAYGVISTIDISENNPTWMWVGCGDGRVQHSDNINTLDVEWFDVTEGLPNRWVSEVRVHADDPGKALVTFSGFGTGHVFYTDNRGTAWTDVSGNLPDVPVNGIVMSRDDPDNTWYAGTDIGVWFTTDGGLNWARFGEGLPNVVVYDIDIDDENRLIAGTHGRGMWITDAEPVLAADSPSAPEAFAVTQNYPNPFATASGTTIGITLSQSSDLTVRLYDATGRLLRTVAEARYAPGRHTLHLATAELNPGVYFYAVSDGSQTVTRKIAAF